MGVPLNSTTLVTVFGGSGFVGRHVVRALAKTGTRIRVAVRRPDLAGHLQPMGGVGQIHAVQANVRYPQSVARAANRADAVINLVGILAQSGKQTFDAVHVSGARAIAEAARDEGAAAMLHMSAIGADARSEALYGRTKAAAEEAVRKAFPEAVILRPSVIFGPEDDFINRLAALVRLSPILPLIGGGKTRFQPVFVGDVAAAVIAGLRGQAKAQDAYELGGPEILSFREIFELIVQHTGRRRAFLSIPFWLAALQGRALQLLPSPPLTLDQVRLLRRDSIVSEAAKRDGRDLEGLGLATPLAMNAVLPVYLERFRAKGEFSTHFG